MSTVKTPAAIHAIEELISAGFINSILRGRILDPAPAGAEHHPNWQLFESVEWYLTCREITHAADILNAYCQALLAEAFEHSPDLWDRVQENKRFPRKWTREAAIEKLQIQRASDGVIRAILGEDLSTFWNPEMDLIAKIRNKIVHQGGFDHEREIESAIADCQGSATILAPIEHVDGKIPIEVDSSGKLKIDARAGKWATDHVLHNIYMMDQNWMGHFNIPGKRYVMKKRSFSMRGGSTSSFLPPGTPLPSSAPTPASPEPLPELPPFPEYTEMISQEEIECARTWENVRNETFEFILEYTAEIGAKVCKVRPAIPGRFPSTTVTDHEHHIGIEVAADLSDDHAMSMGIRFRQNNSQPFLTIWSDKTMMKDFEPCELTEEVKEHLRDCIEGAMTA